MKTLMIVTLLFGFRAMAAIPHTTAVNPGDQVVFSMTGDPKIAKLVMKILSVGPSQQDENYQVTLDQLTYDSKGNLLDSSRYSQTFDIAKDFKVLASLEKCGSKKITVTGGTFEVCGSTVLIGGMGLQGTYTGLVPLALVKQISGNATMEISDYIPAANP